MLHLPSFRCIFEIALHLLVTLKEFIVCSKHKSAPDVPERPFFIEYSAIRRNCSVFIQVIKEWQLRQLREQYPAGTRVELIYMNAPYNRKLVPGCQGTVRWVDDMGTMHVSWGCGSSLGLIPGEDAWQKI